MSLLFILDCLLKTLVIKKSMFFLKSQSEAYIYRTKFLKIRRFNLEILNSSEWVVKLTGINVSADNKIHTANRGILCFFFSFFTALLVKRGVFLGIRHGED